MRPSSRLSLNPDLIYSDRRARQRARWLFDFVCEDVCLSPEFLHMPPGADRDTTPVHCAIACDRNSNPFPERVVPLPGKWGEYLARKWLTRLPRKARTYLSKRWRVGREDRADLKKDQVLRLVAEVADSYPRLLAWLTEGRVSGFWNIFGTLISLITAIPVARYLTWCLIFRPVSRHAPWRFALRDVILQEERSEFNRLLASRSGGSLDISGYTQAYGTQGLSAVTDVAMIAQTAAREDLRQRVESMSSGCIGVSGLPGSGKTTLIRDFCRHRYGSPVWKGSRPDDRQSELPGLRFTVQAPLRYHPLEFLIHQYTCLCKAVLADQRLNPAGFLHRIVISFLVPQSIRPAALLRGLTGIALAGLTAVLFYRAAVHSWPLLSWLERDWQWLTGAAALFAVFIVATSPTRRALAEVRQIVNLSTDAQNRLERLHFQRTDTHGSGAAVSGPPWANVTFSSSHALTEQMMTLPELIDDYRDFAERVVAALQQAIRSDKNWRAWHDVPGRGGSNGEPARIEGPDSEPRNIDVRLVIGIDEMDRIEDNQQADNFLAELSSVFGTPHCVYLISVSPGALATSDQRLVSPKTASNGIFDEMVWVDPLDLPTAGRLLDRRVIGMPFAFVALCYVLSGGLPRDLLRIARGISQSDGDDAQGAASLADVAREILYDEFWTLKHRTLANAAVLQVPATGELLRLLSPEHRPGGRVVKSGRALRAADIEATMEAFSRLWEKEEDRQRFKGADDTIAPLTAEVCDSYLAGLYFLRTVCHLFTAHHQLVTELATAEQGNGPAVLLDNEILRGLARARIALGVNPYLAARLIDEAIEDLRRRPGPDLSLDSQPPFLSDHTPFGVR